MRRKVFYQAAGQRHYYFMNVGNGEVIDACRMVSRRRCPVICAAEHYLHKNSQALPSCHDWQTLMMHLMLQGALGRFINHSCEPNCETQKWLVQGELAIGLFAQRDIKAGEELTFDYNFERYGDKVGADFITFCMAHCHQLQRYGWSQLAAWYLRLVRLPSQPMKCLCGSKGCRGFVGGTQETIAARLAVKPCLPAACRHCTCCAIHILGPQPSYLQTLTTWRLPTGLHRTVAPVSHPVLCATCAATLRTRRMHRWTQSPSWSPKPSRTRRCQPSWIRTSASVQTAGTRSWSVGEAVGHAVTLSLPV